MKIFGLLVLATRLMRRDERSTDTLFIKETPFRAFNDEMQGIESYLLGYPCPLPMFTMAQGTIPRNSLKL